MALQRLLHATVFPRDSTAPAPKTAPDGYSQGSEGLELHGLALKQKSELHIPLATSPLRSLLAQVRSMLFGVRKSFWWRRWTPAMWTEGCSPEREVDPKPRGVSRGLGSRFILRGPNKPESGGAQPGMH